MKAEEVSKETASQIEIFYQNKSLLTDTTRTTWAKCSANTHTHIHTQSSKIQIHEYIHIQIHRHQVGRVFSCIAFAGFLTSPNPGGLLQKKHYARNIKVTRNVSCVALSLSKSKSQYDHAVLTKNTNNTNLGETTATRWGICRFLSIPPRFHKRVPPGKETQIFQKSMDGQRIAMFDVYRFCFLLWRQQLRQQLFHSSESHCVAKVTLYCNQIINKTQSDSNNS